MDYTTQMDAARKGIITKEMLRVAEREKIAVEKIKTLVAAGKVVIPANKNHLSLDPCGIAEFLAVVEKHAADGVDFMTIHAGLNRAREKTVSWRAFLCVRTIGDRYRSRLRSYYFRHRRGGRSSRRSRFSLLCDPCRTFATSHHIRYGRGDYRRPDRRSRR